MVPLGSRPDKCFNAITPRDMHSSLSCAWSGALLEAGSMCAVMWSKHAIPYTHTVCDGEWVADLPGLKVLLRSIWTHMRVCWDIKHTPMYMYIAHAIGWGLPLIFLAISLSITGVSYRLGGTCIPNPNNVRIETLVQ